METSRRGWLIGALLIVGVIAWVAGPRAWHWGMAPPAGCCPFCHRHAHKESLVRFRAEGEGVTEACCLSCALNYGRQTHKALTIVSVTEHESGNPLDPNAATFLVGADVSPCTHLDPTMEVGPEHEVYPVRWDRCLPSILAFASPASANAFQRQHGGQLRSLQELLAADAQSDRGDIGDTNRRLPRFSCSRGRLQRAPVRRTTAVS